MTNLRKVMLEELQRRNYAANTIDGYIYAIEDFARRFKRSPDRLGPRHVREYQAEQFRKRKFASNTVTIYLVALRFLYTKSLEKGALEFRRSLFTSPGHTFHLCRPDFVTLYSDPVSKGQRLKDNHPLLFSFFRL